jgi:hypothetical protein
MEKMKIKIIIILSLLLSFTLLYCRNLSIQDDNKSDLNSDSLNFANLVPESYYLELEKNNDNFLTKILKFYNKSNKILYIYNVESSCGCSNATVLASSIQPADSGSLYLSINLKGLYDERNIVEYKIFSNSLHSPSIIKIKIKESENKDTLKK